MAILGLNSRFAGKNLGRSIQCCNPESPHFYFNYLTALAEVFTLDNIHGVQTCSMCLDDKVESINDAFGSDDSNSPFQRMTVNNLFLSLSIPKHIFKILYVRTRVERFTCSIH